MSQDIQADPVQPRVFFQAPAFWVGGVMWIGVLIAGLVLWLKQMDKPKTSDISQGSVQSDKPIQENEQPRKLVLSQDKNGNITIGSPPKDGSTVWDADGIADFAFTDTEGKTVTKADLLGKPWIVCFVFTHCAATCPAVTNSMRELQDRLKNYDFRLITLTVDPERDTAEVSKGYGESYGADFRKWSFLRGDQRDIYRLIEGSFKMPVEEVTGDKRKQGFEFIHSNNIMLVDSMGVVRGKFNATSGTDMANLRRELEKLADRNNEAQ